MSWTSDSASSPTKELATSCYAYKPQGIMARDLPTTRPLHHMDRAPRLRLDSTAELDAMLDTSQILKLLRWKDARLPRERVEAIETAALRNWML